MCRRIRFTLVLFVAVIKLTSTGSAVGQLSKARRAVRATPAATAEPASTAETTKPETAQEPQKPQPVPVQAPPAPRQKQRPTPPSQTAIVTELAPRPVGSLGRVRQEVRANEHRQPVVPPVPGTPPVHHKPAPISQQVVRNHRSTPFHPRHAFYRSQAFAWAPAPCIHETVIINELAPPPLTVFEQPLLVSQQPVIVESAAAASVPAVSEGCMVGQPDFLTPQCAGPLRFHSFPYEFGNEGIMAFGLQKDWSGSALFEYGSSFDGLDRRGFGFLLEHSTRIGIDVKWDSYIEDIGGGLTDELHLTDINVLFRIAESPNYLVRVGLGANILGDAFGTDGGFNLTAKADFFPAEPLVVSGEIDMGTIGDAEMFHAAGKIGLMINRFELFGGYDYRTIGGVPLQGAMMGVQIWF